MALLYTAIHTVARAGPADVAIADGTTAEAIFSTAPQRLLQIRTLVGDSDRQVSTGSGFLVSGDGLAVTNYHVVAQAALDPKTYRLEYRGADGAAGELKLLAVDLANDLAIIRVDKHDIPFFRLAGEEPEEGLPKGERLYSMGNPLNLGFSIVEGTYNGFVERSYSERIHFTGALNPGMSGGPAVNAEGTVVGINVSKRTDGELVSFLVPVEFAAALLQRVKEHPADQPTDFNAEIGRQLAVRQEGVYKSLLDLGFRSISLGSYQAPEAKAPWFTCWEQTNAGDVPKPRASVNSTNCSSDTGLFVASDLNTGRIQLSHSYLRSVDLNQFQFAAFLSQRSQPGQAGGGGNRKWYTAQGCQDDFIKLTTAEYGPPLNVVWCAHAYRRFPGLYDVAILAVTEDHGGEALVSRLNLQAVAYEPAVMLAKKFLEAVEWRR
jgi:serine protease Do